MVSTGSLRSGKLGGHLDSQGSNLADTYAADFRNITCNDGGKLLVLKFFFWLDPYLHLWTNHSNPVENGHGVTNWKHHYRSNIYSYLLLHPVLTGTAKKVFNF